MEKGVSYNLEKTIWDLKMGGGLTEGGIGGIDCIGINFLL